ncbi:MAG: NAD(P)H-hydrate dehydratase [Candidatus Njordarchaeum guaymaensis]
MSNLMKPEDVYRLDLNSEFLGIPPDLLMENAGSAVARRIQEILPSGKIVVIAGLGNNGGDGLVCARFLASMGYNVTVILLGRENQIRSDVAKRKFSMLKKMILSLEIVQIKDSTQLDTLEELLINADLVVDAIFGVGLKGAVKGFYAEVIKKINEIKRSRNFLVVSIDVPSGFDAYARTPKGVFVKADYTVTFHKPKDGLTEQIAGKILVENIGIPPEAEIFCGPGDLKLAIKERAPWSHKGDFGRILVIGGSRNYSGAPTLASLAALNTGADLVITAVPEGIANVIRSYSPDLIVYPLPGEYFSMEGVKLLEQEILKYDAIILGPGLGLFEESLKAASQISRYIAEKGIPLIIDADGLKAIAKYGIPSGNVILTPHAGEFKILFGELPPKDLHEKGILVKEKAFEFRVTIVLKGHIDVISDGEAIRYNATGNPGMTVGGTGDVLSGIIGALVAQCKNPFLASCAGAFLSGVSGDLAFKEKGYEFLASDVIHKIPYAINKYIRN